MKTTIRRHPLVAYFLLVYAIAWIGSFVVMGPKFLRGEEILFTDIIIIAIPMLAAPSLTGIALTAIMDGQNGLRSLFRRMSHWRVDRRWYAALLIFPLLILAVYRLLYLVVSPAYVPTFFAIGFQMGLAAGFLEEIGWMGFAFPHMRASRSVLVTAILLGLLHSLWHLAAGYLGASTVRGVYFLPHFLAFTVAMTAMRVLVVWV